MKNILLSLLTIACLLTSCEEPDPNFFKKNALGNAGDVLVIMADHRWDKEEGQIVKDSLEQLYYGLSQRETQYKLIHYNFKYFSNTQKSYGNIILAKIGKGQKTKFKVVEDRYAWNQLIIEVSAPNAASFVELFKKSYAQIHQLIGINDVNKQIAFHKTHEAADLQEAVDKKLGIQMTVPKGYRLGQNTGNEGVWLVRERMMMKEGTSHDMHQGIMIHTFSYRTDTIFELEYLLNLRDRIAKAYVETEDDDDWMRVTRDEDFYPEGGPINFNGKFAFQTKGIWQLDKGYMGGPFVNVVTVDENNKRVIMIDGYVYGPKFRKMKYVREVEAIIKSITF